MFNKQVGIYLCIYCQNQFIGYEGKHKYSIRLFEYIACNSFLDKL